MSVEYRGATAFDTIVAAIGSKELHESTPISEGIRKILSLGCYVPEGIVSVN